MDNSVRKSLRFPPDEGTVAWIDLVVRENKKEFKPTVPALVIDEALDGCGVVTLFHTRLSEDSECLVQVGNLDPLRAQVRWIKDLDDDVFKIGLMYLE